jgi:hypothetical protein
VGHSFADFTPDLFQPYVGQTFAFAASGEDAETVPMELLEVQTLRASGHPGLRAAPFLLLFRSADGRTPARDWIRLIHPDFAACELTVQRIMPPLGWPPAGVYFQAVFN